MNLGAFHTDISRTLRRGTSQDALIPDMVRRAARWLEENYSFDYMRKFGEVNLDPLAAEPERIDFPTDRVKSINFVRFPTMTGVGISQAYSYIEQVSPEDVSSTDFGVISGYWLDSNAIVLDGIANQAIPLQYSWYEYTDWPVDGAATPRLLQIGEKALRHQTFVEFAGELKDARMGEHHNTELQKALSTMLRAQEEKRIGSSKIVMRPRVAGY